MSDMTHARLAEIRARLEGATPGPWTDEENDFSEVHIRAPSRQHKTEIAAVSVGYDEPMEAEQRANIALIFNAPDDLRDLLAEVERLRAALTAARERTYRSSYGMGQQIAEICAAALGEDRT